MSVASDDKALRKPPRAGEYDKFTERQCHVTALDLIGVASRTKKWPVLTDHLLALRTRHAIAEAERIKAEEDAILAQAEEIRKRREEEASI